MSFVSKLKIKNKQLQPEGWQRCANVSILKFLCNSGKKYILLNYGGFLVSKLVEVVYIHVFLSLHQNTG